MATSLTKKKGPTPPRLEKAGADGGLSAARRVFAIEAEGLAAAARALDGEFVAAIDALHRIKGRIIVSGMGKSGHIAHKIAATLASTGSPAFFVHPAEASHGDLGMITREDAVIAISHSGATAELADLIQHTRRFKIPLVAITAGGSSQLAEAADVLLALPRVKEACPMGLAPTTSTTVTLAMGDALAIALLERRGFTSDDFQLLHPGGQLGKKLLKVADIMHKGDAIPTCAPADAMSDVLITMTAKRFGCIAVLKGSRLAGIITDGDLRRHFQNPGEAAAAQTLMTKSPHVATADSLAGEVLALFAEKKITAVFLVDEGQVPIGLIHVHDCLTTGVI